MPDPDDRAPVKAILCKLSILSERQCSTDHFSARCPDTYRSSSSPREARHRYVPWYETRVYALAELTNRLGTFPTGEARLLFSSKQVDYIRYWLHAMKLTKNVIPLPYSDCLILAKELKTVSPVTYINGSSLRSAIKVKFRLGGCFGRLLIFSSFRTSTRITKDLKVQTLIFLNDAISSNACAAYGERRKVSSVLSILRLGSAIIN